MLQPNLTSWIGLLASLLVGGGSGVGVKYLYDFIVLKRHRVVEVESIALDSDTKRIQMADSIITQFSRRVETMENKIRHQDEIIHKQNRRIARLERMIILAGLELPAND
jgi:hypothetical protein